MIEDSDSSVASDDEGNLQGTPDDDEELEVCKPAHKQSNEANPLAAAMDAAVQETELVIISSCQYRG